MKVTVIAHTRFEYGVAQHLSEDVWTVDHHEAFNDNDSSLLTEFAGRACYQSWSKPNPQTASNHGYLANIIDQQHFSVMEHGSASFYVQDVSRSLTHELVRHRHLSYSQLSQRFVAVSINTDVVMPPLYQDDVESTGILAKAWDHAVRDYETLVSIWMPRLLQAGYDVPRARKKAREAARCVLPNMTPTAIVVTGNHRAWREMLAKRGTIYADAEIRELALRLHELLARLEPNLYQDFRATTINGEEVLHHDNQTSQG